MSQLTSKKKGRRPTGIPTTETNTSFVRIVTSRVSGLLPFTITNWLGSSSSSDSSSDEETFQPLAKRMRIDPADSDNHYTAPEPSCSNNDVKIMEMPYSYSVPQYAQPGPSNYPTQLQPTNDDNDITERETSHIFKLPHTVTSIGQSIANKRKSIFDKDLSTIKEDTAKAGANQSSDSMRDPKQPSFKPSLLGSPFYPGRTMYGGASSYHINQPNIRQKPVALLNESKNDDTAISSSARRVMDLLESYSSPLTEARRIPLYSKPKNDGFKAPSVRNPISHKTQELYVPSIATILQLKKKSRLMDTTNTARQIIASHSSTPSPAYPASPKRKEPENENPPNKMTTKIKSRLTRTNREKPEEPDVGTEINLPAVTLQIDPNKLPNFSFGIPAATPHPATTHHPATSTPKSSFVTSDKKITKDFQSKPGTVTSSVFKFSNPVTVSNEIPPTPDKEFKFGSPDIDRKFENKSYDSSVVVGVPQEPEKPEIKTKSSTDWQCSECWVKNKPEDTKCVCCGSKKPSQKVKCSICKVADSQSQKDKCANCEKPVLSLASPPPTTSTGATVVSQSSKWKCDDCWVSNYDSAVKCACCGGNRPKKANALRTEATSQPTAITWTATSGTSQPTTSKSSTVTTNSEADWKCNDCWVSNKSSVEKCVACGGARPGAKQSTKSDVPANSSFFGSGDNAFKNIIKSQKSDKWECISCLVQNESCKDKCVCCGAEREIKKKITATKFNFSLTGNNSFKFGIDPKVQESSIAKMPQVISIKESNKPKAQSETNNNILAETPLFTLPKVETVNNDSEKSGESSKLNNPFVIKSNQIPKDITNNLPEAHKDIEEEKLQEVPSVDLNLPVQEKTLDKVFMFPATSKIEENKALPSKNLLNPLATEINKDTPSLPITFKTIAKSDNPTPTFSFGVNQNSKVFETPNTGTSINMFTKPTETITLPTTSTLSLSLPSATSTSTTSLFQQPDMTPKPISLFKNSESTNNAAAAPMFTFGNNGISNATPTPAAPAEKPKFQFTFGSNIPTTESQNLFKSPFGSTESNVNSTSFSLSAGTTLGNAPNTNTLGGSNGPSASNALSGNLLTGNTFGSLSGNPLAGNTLAMGNASPMTSAMGGSNGLSSNPLSGGNGLQTENLLTGSATGLFNNAVQKENVWGAASNNAPTPNLFVTNTVTSSLQKPPAFSFGSSTPFNSPSNTPTFGTNSAPQQNIFGMGNQNNNSQPSMFSVPVQNQPTGNLFGSPQPASNPPPQMSMFGTPSIGATPGFSSQSPIPSFEQPALPAPPASTFTFSATQSTGVFGFGQQQQQQLQQPHIQQSTPQTGVYNFGGAPAGAPQVQFTLGSGGRRVRKAVRRTQPR